MKKVSLVILTIIFLSTLAMSQMKKIEGTQPLPGLQKNYQLWQKPNTVREKNYQASTSVQFKSIPFVSPQPFTSLKPGMLNDEGLPVYIKGKMDKIAKNLSIEAQAYAYIEAAKPLMKITDGNISFQLVNTHLDELGIHHFRMQQYYKNIPVYGAEIILHGSEEGFDFLNGQYSHQIFLDQTLPNIEFEEAEQFVLSDFPNWLPLLENQRPFLPNKRIDSELVIFKDKNQIFSLVYHISAYPNIGERWEYFIDANTGKILDKYPSLCKFHAFGKTKGESCNHELDGLNTNTRLAFPFFDGKADAVAKDLLNVNRLINTYQVGSNFYLIDASRDMFSNQSSFPNDPVGTIWTINAFNTSPAKSNFNYDHVTSSNNTWTNSPAGVSSHYNGGKAFEYFRIVHNRNSIDGKGGNIVSFINVADDDGSSMGNAFWNGAAMFYGNGDNAFLPLARGLDVAGHEMSHGVIQNTANLVYQGESGALNESFADIFGVMIDRDDWEIGEDVVKSSAFPSGALRSMSNPHNGAQTNDFGRGWQPKHYNERYTGNEDNGGVHINSGIPNHAFFLFSSAVGKEKAERVFYRALSQYLTKSSKFVDCRVAVVKATNDLYGASEANAAKKAFTDVGILGDSGGTYENDAPQNPGQDFILFTDQNKNGLYMASAAGQPVSFANPLTSRSIISKPSISDDGTEIVYVGADKKLYYILINWSTNQKQEFVLGDDPVWRNAVISKDGFKIAAVTEELVNEIYVFDFTGTNVVSNIFELYNPTFTNGVITGDVKYADAMEFDISGEYIMYDAENEINGNSGNITYWDIGFIKVWNNSSSTFALGSIEKLFSALPNDVSTGNPTFSKNSPYIIAFDYIEGGFSYLVGANLETGNVQTIFENDILAYPTYSSNDNQMMFDYEDVFDLTIARINLQANKISSVANSGIIWAEGFRWATWFSNGDRVLSGNQDPVFDHYKLFVFPNPAHQDVFVTFENEDASEGMILLYDVHGKVVLTQNISLIPGHNEIQIPVSSIQSGTYFINVKTNSNQRAIKMVKIVK
ncbi:MAG: M4 family metallopeptidase [Saprospiraceae bacterium]